MNSLYDLDPKWRALLNSSNFLGGLRVNEFVQELGKDHYLRADTASSTDNGPDQAQGDSVNGGYNAQWAQLDAKPYIRTFESTLKELGRLSRETQQREAQLREQMENEELAYAKRVQALTRDLKKLTANYDQLETGLTDVTHVVAPLGDKLETSIRRKRTYVKAVELIAQYNEFSLRGRSAYIESLNASANNWKRQTQAATLVRNLVTLASKVETSLIPQTTKVLNILKKYSADMEANLLSSFNTAYRENDFKKLNEIAIILRHLNGGVNVIQNFINQHQYFQSSSNELSAEAFEEDVQFRSKLLDPKTRGVIISPTVALDLDKIATIIKDEAKVVKRVFDDKAAYVMQLFIQRVFADKLEPKLNVILETSLTISNLAYVRTLHALYTLLSEYTKDLTEYFQALEMNTSSVLVTNLESLYSDYFAKFLFDRSKYFDIEKASLESVIWEQTSPFIVNHERDVRSKNLLYKLRARLENNNAGIDISSRETGSKLSRSKLSQINDFFKSHLDRELLKRTASFKENTPEWLRHGSNKKIGTEKVLSNSFNTNLDHNISIDADFSIEHVDIMLKCVVEATARIMELVPNKASSFTYEVIEIMGLGIIGSYVENGLEVAFNMLNKMEVTKETQLDLSFLQYISTSTKILGLISIAVKAVFLPLLNNFPEAKIDIIELANTHVKRTELLVNILLESLIEIYLVRFTSSLAKQKKKDFTPKTQELLDQDTLPATEIVSDLQSLHAQASLYLVGDNLKSVLTRIGMDLYQLLVNHYSKFQVSSTGGIVVTKDIIGFLNVVEEWGIPAVTESFMTLRELANLFTVQPDLLDSLTKEGHLTGINRTIISTYIANREDFGREKFMIGGRFIKQFA